MEKIHNKHRSLIKWSIFMEIVLVTDAPNTRSEAKNRKKR